MNQIQSLGFKQTERHLVNDRFWDWPLAAGHLRRHFPQNAVSWFESDPRMLNGYEQETKPMSANRKLWLGF